MQTDLWQRRIGWCAAVAVMLFSGPLAQFKFATAEEPKAPQQPAEKPERVVIESRMVDQVDANGEHHQVPITEERVIRTDGSDPATSKRLFQQLTEKYPQAFQSNSGDGKFWLGVECREVSPELQSQLGLKEGEGLVVMQLIQDSPAAKAGLKQHDIVISVGDGKLAHPADLVKAVNAADGKEITLKILRGGKEQTIAATPLERSQPTLSFIARPNPGVVIPNMMMQHMQLPDNVSVSIMRQGNKPEKITVSRGDEKWEIDDHELNKLPDDLRPFVQGMLGGGPMTFNMPNMMNRAGDMNMPNMNRAMESNNSALVQALKAIYGAQAGGQPGQPGMPNGVWLQPQQPGQAAQAMPPTPNGTSGGQPAMHPRPMAAPGPGASDVMQRLDEIDRRLQQLQDEIRGGQPGPRDPNGPRRDNPPPQ